MSGTGVCEILKEFVIQRKPFNGAKCDSDSSIQQENELFNLDVAEEGEPPLKKSKILKDNSASIPAPKQKPRGQNTGRPKPLRLPVELRPCPSIVNVPEGSAAKTCLFTGCKFIHDPLVYLKNKPQDITTDKKTCYIHDIKGECPWGLSCCFGSSHISSEGKNIINVEKSSAWVDSTLNVVSFDLLTKLQKRKYDLNIAENMVNDMKKERAVAVANRAPCPLNQTVSSDYTIEPMKQNNAEQKIVCPTESVGDIDLIPLKPREIKRLDWKNKLYLGPLTTLGNLPFRRICKEFGADITCGEMALCDSLLKGLKQEWALVKRHDSEDFFGVQICGSNPYSISKTALLLQREINVDFIDLNLGCPIDLIYKKGGGCGLLLRTNALETGIKCASNILSIPFTIKTRTGVYQDKNIAHQLAPKFTDWGVSMLTIHGRSREQRYTKFANWEYINECAAAASPCPVFGNGDIFSYDDYKKSLETAPNITGVMMGRGALIKPWIFSEIKEQKLWDIRSSERFNILKKYTNYGLEHWGSDSRGVENTRRFLLEWLSFLHRYVPVGLLERPPQRINERPPYYRGRDDLETLMASPNCADWITLSEMLVGPVPDGFHFLPKHRANSYN